MSQSLTDYSASVKRLKTDENPVVLEPKWSSQTFANGFFNQRFKQSRYLFNFALIMSSVSLAFLIVIVFFQFVLKLRTGNPDMQLLSDNGLEVVAVSIFGQIFGVIYIIAKALWSNHEFKFMENK